MKRRYYKLMSLVLCLTTATPILTFAISTNQGETVKETSTYVGTPSEALFDQSEDQDINKTQLEKSQITPPSMVNLLEVQKTFMDYFPDPNFAQVVAKHFAGTKDSVVTLEQLSTIQEISISDNREVSSIEGIDNLTNLQHLVLSNNQITEIPESIGQLTYLEYLGLDNNCITEIPNSIGQLTKLGTIFLDNNRITEIPESIGQLTYLISLRLSDNHITEFPEIINQLTHLKDIHLSGNEITKIPVGIGQVSDLEYLDLSRNKIASRLPTRLLSHMPMFYVDIQHGVLDTLYFTDPLEITYEQLTTPLILHTQENNNGLLYGKWSIKKPDGSTISIDGEDGSEITATLFNQLGSYVVSFQWTLTEPYPHMIYPWSNSNSLDFNSEIEITIGQTTEIPHYVTLITRYLDEAVPETSQVYAVANGSRFEQQYDILNGYTVHTSQLRSIPDFDVNSSTNTVSIDPVNRNYTIELEFGRKIYEVEVITRYLDNALPESSQYYEVEHGAEFQIPYDVLDNYSLYTSELRSLPDFNVDTINHLITVDPVERNHTVILEFDKTEYEVLLTTSYQDNAYPEQIYEDWIKHGDDYSRTYGIAEGYQIANLDQLSEYIIVDENANTVTINDVTQGHEINLEFAKKQHTVEIKVVYADGSRDDQVTTQIVPHGEAFNTSFTVDRGYTVNRVNSNALGVVVNHVRKMVSISQVVSSIELTIFVQ